MIRYSGHFTLTEIRLDTSLVSVEYSAQLVKHLYSCYSSSSTITELVTPLLPKRKTKGERNLKPIDMVLITLQYYATGSFQCTVGNVLRYSQSSVSRSITVVSLALSLVSKRFIKFPQDLNKVQLPIP